MLPAGEDDVGGNQHVQSRELDVVEHEVDHRAVNLVNEELSRYQ